MTGATAGARLNTQQAAAVVPGGVLATLDSSCCAAGAGPHAPHP